MGIISLAVWIYKHPMNSEAPFGGLIRFFRWQIASRVFLGDLAIPFVGSSRLLAKSGTTGATGNYYCGLHEPDDMAFVLHFLREGDLFCDVGANIGSYTVLAATQCGAKVVAFEPAPKTFQRLRDNVAINHIENLVDMRMCAIGSTSGSLLFSTDSDTMNHVVDGNYIGEKVSVKVGTLDAELADRIPLLVKMDIEGFELEALRGAGGIFGNTEMQALIMETNASGTQYGHSDIEIIQLIESFGFIRAQYDPICRNVVAAQDVSSSNSLFVRDLNVVNQRVSAAKKFQLANGRLI